MTRHFNPTITSRLLNMFNLKTGDQFSDELSPNVVAVIPVTPVVNLVRSQERIITGSSTIFTTELTRDTFCTGLTYTFTKNVDCDITAGAYGIQTIIDGVSVLLLRCSMVPLKAQDGVVSISFPYPIKIDRGVTVFITGSYASGLMVRSATFYGYTEETNST